VSAAPSATAAGLRPLRLFDLHPRSAAVAAAVGISFAAILFVLSDASPSTATFFRFSETPSSAQLAGVVLIVGGVLLGSTVRGRAGPAAGAPTGTMAAA
jgi:drug/metabolite transporter (DMT)-like permease